MDFAATALVTLGPPLVTMVELAPARLAEVTVAEGFLLLGTVGCLVKVLLALVLPLFLALSSVSARASIMGALVTSYLRAGVIFCNELE